MSIDELNKIDGIITDKEKTTVVLLISDHLDWEEEGEHLVLLQEKLNAYLHFIEGGELDRTRPGLKGLPITIRIAAKYSLSAEAVKFYHLAGPAIAEIGVSLEFRLGKSEKVSRF